MSSNFIYLEKAPPTTSYFEYALPSADVDTPTPNLAPLTRQNNRNHRTTRLWQLPTTVSNRHLPRLRPRQVSLRRVRIAARRRQLIQETGDVFTDLLTYYLSIEEYNPYAFLYAFETDY